MLPGIRRNNSGLSDFEMKYSSLHPGSELKEGVHVKQPARARKPFLFAEAQVRGQMAAPNVLRLHFLCPVPLLPRTSPSRGPGNPSHTSWQDSN